MTTVTAAYLPRATTRDKRVAPPRAYGRYAIATKLRDAVVELVRSEAAGRPGARLVDFGCGDMPYRPLVREWLGSYEGIDLPGNAEAAYHLLPDGRTTAPSGCADLVLSTQVLEHVADVGVYLSECRRMLRPGGAVLLTTHGTWVHHPDPRDLWRWTSEGLRETLGREGLEVVRLSGVLGLMALGVQQFQDGLVRKLPRVVRPGVCFALQQGVLLADRFHTDAERARDACVYAVVARARGDSSALC